MYFDAEGAFLEKFYSFCKNELKVIFKNLSCEIETFLKILNIPPESSRTLVLGVQLLKRWISRRFGFALDTLLYFWLSTR